MEKIFKHDQHIAKRGVMFHGRGGPVDRDVNQLQSEEKYLSAFLASMKQRDQDNLDQARKALRQMKSYSTSWQNGRGFRIRIKGGKEERALHYAFPRVYGD
jgi:acetylglutamate kinase